MTHVQIAVAPLIALTLLRAYGLFVKIMAAEDANKLVGFSIAFILNLAVIWWADLWL